jgi:phosphonate transport system substrate-binding protein
MLQFTTCQAPIAEPLCHEVAAYVGRHLGMATSCRTDISWQERQQQLDSGAIDVGWICGASYVRRRASPARLELLAAPVSAHPRYSGQPVYYSDVVVQHDSPFQRFDDLRGARWAYNEPASHSGYHVVRYHLASCGADGTFFGSVTEAGSHQEALRLIRAGMADAAAIDSTVLELLVAQQPALATTLRAIATLGPSPIPPWVIGTHLSEALRVALRDLLLGMHTDAEGQQILERALLARFTTIADDDYDPIRHMLCVAAPVVL